MKLVSNVRRHSPGERGNVLEAGAGQRVERDVVDDAEARVRAGVDAEVNSLERGRDHAERRAVQRRRRGGDVARERGHERVPDPVVIVVGEGVHEHGRRAEPPRHALDGAQRPRVAGLGDVELAARQRRPHHARAVVPLRLRRRRDDSSSIFLGLGEFETIATVCLVKRWWLHLVVQNRSSGTCELRPQICTKK